ncbi:E3 ubiquitin-protein ligase TRIM21 [Amia ocellicauda]|uniref:E3 ubiquitin-protein ligase TRIM21 n=1 Tax=Amia ocellicauda TaxID=2972642 RepID=UPI0034639C40
MASMGAALDVSEKVPECPLCHRVCQMPSALQCGHCFCLRCIQEVWSGSPTGPYYCPECKAEYRNMPALGRRDTDRDMGPSSSALMRDGAISSSSSLPRQAGDSSDARGRKREGPSLGGERESKRVRDLSGSAAHTEEQSSVPCNYCTTAGQRAVKTCLVCGASMCAKHLQIHLEVPVFQSHPLVQPTADISAWKCLEHQEMLKIYCQECSLCVCTVCTVIGAHKNHFCVSVSEAEQELRKNLKDGMNKIEENGQIVQDRVGVLLEKKLNIQRMVSEARAHVQQQYESMRQALQKEEQKALQVLSQEEARVLGSIEAHVEQLEDTLHTIEQNVGVLEKLSDTTGPSRMRDQAFIKEYSKIASSVSELSRPLEELEPPQEINRRRLERLQEWADRRLEAVTLPQTDRNCLLALYGTSPSLNPDTVYSKLVLSQENRCVSYSEEAQPYPPHVARFSNFPQVLGSQAWDGGRCYWEVEVSGEGRWKVGVCGEQISRKGTDDACRLGYSNNSWCLYGDCGKMEVLHNKEVLPLAHSPPCRVGVFVDFEDSSLSFYSVTEDTLTLLHRFQESFTQPLFPALAASKTQLTICSVFQ